MERYYRVRCKGEYILIMNQIYIFIIFRFKNYSVFIFIGIYIVPSLFFKKMFYSSIFIFIHYVYIHHKLKISAE